MLGRILDPGGWREGEFTQDLSEALRRARLVEISEPLSYFFDGAPEEELSVEDFPNVDPPFRGSFFFEARAPERLKAGYKAWTPAGFLTVGGADARRVGFAVVAEEKPPGAAVFDEQIEAAIADARVAVHVAPFLEDSRGGIRHPGFVWMVPVLPDGRAMGIGPEGQVPTLLHPDSPLDETSALLFTDAHAPLLGGFLFAVCAMNAAPSELASVRERRDNGGDEFVVETGALEALLDGRGRAREDGLGSAMSTCRESFFCKRRG